MTKTVIYLDVDGVLNAVCGRSLPEFAGWDTWQRERINGYTITFSPELVDALHKIADRDDVEIRWLTTWRDMAQTHISPGIKLNGTDWAVVADGAPGHGYLSDIPPHASGWWKMDALIENILDTKPERVIWVDDDLAVFHREAQQVLDSFEFINAWKIVLPRTDTGLTVSSIDGILEFLDNPWG